MLGMRVAASMFLAGVMSMPTMMLHLQKLNN